MTMRYHGKALPMAFGIAILLTSCVNAGVRLEKKYDNPQDFSKVFPEEALDPLGRQNEVIHFVYYESKLSWWAFWNIPYPQPVWEIEMLVTPTWLYADENQWEISKEDEEFFNLWVLEDRLADWFVPDSANYEVWCPYVAEHKYPLIFVDKRTRSDGMIHVFVRNHLNRARVHYGHPT